MALRSQPQSAMSSSSSPEPHVLQKKKSKKSKSKGKEVAKSLAMVIDEDSDTDADMGNHYQPPSGSKLVSHDVNCGDFDWDKLDKDEDLDLWIIRVPDGVKPKNLEGLEISMPSSSHSGLVGSVSKKHTRYDIWSIQRDADNSRLPVAGEEVFGLTCLLPRQKNGGKLFTAPKPIARHLIVTAQHSLPTPDPSSPELPILDPAAKAARRYRHPEHLLKHRFLPSGSTTARASSTPMEVDVDGSVENPPVETQLDSSPGKKIGGKEKKDKKRKGDTESPKKVKKPRTAD